MTCRYLCNHKFKCISKRLELCSKNGEGMLDDRYKQMSSRKEVQVRGEEDGGTDRRTDGRTCEWAHSCVGFINHNSNEAVVTRAFITIVQSVIATAHVQWRQTHAQTASGRRLRSTRHSLLP